MELNYCPVCGARLVRRDHPMEAPTLYCTHCGDWRFPLFSTAVTAAVWNREHTALLLIWQYGEKDPVFPAGYVDKGETAEQAVKRELREELGIGGGGRLALADPGGGGSPHHRGPGTRAAGRHPEGGEKKRITKKAEALRFCLFCLQ